MKPISNTAFYCCGIRMRDAESPRPVCADQYAKRFMDARGLEIFREFGGERGPNASNVARHRYIDDFLRAQLSTEPRLRIILLGCGFDSRAFRLEGGAWYELDEPQLIAYKNERLPAAQAPNPLQRIPVDFAADSLQEKLRPLANGAPTVLVIEGVTMYLPAESLRATLEVLKTLFPGHRVIADLMTAHFIDHYGRNIKRIIAQLGAQMIPPDAPALPFEQAGYREQSRVAIIGLIFKYRSLGALNLLLRGIMPAAYTGYTMRVFQHATGG
ncbi:MAG: class I SAM-dependent methyltransferase [Steroidobacteraceae bacterium]